ncbi:MAG: alpha/beta hydrolase [Mycobacteriaceae bacterium]
MPFFRGTSTAVFFRSWTVPGNKVTLLFALGSGQQLGHYYRFFRRLSEAGIDVWAFDHPGYGLSEGDAEQAISLEEAVSNLLKLSCFTESASQLWVGGHSVGALAALLCLMRSPQNFSGAVITGFPVPKRMDSTEVELVQLHRELKLLSSRVVAWHGAEDRIAPITRVQQWCSGLGSFELREIADTGHDVLHEKAAERVIAEMVEILLLSEVSS